MRFFTFPSPLRGEPEGGVPILLLVITIALDLPQVRLHRFYVIFGLTFCASKSIWSCVILLRSLARAETAAFTAAKRVRASVSFAVIGVVRVTQLAQCFDKR